MVTDQNAWSPASFWQEHGVHVGAVVVGALLFRLLAAWLTLKLKDRFKEHDLSIAVYRLTGLVHHTIQVPVAFYVLMDKRMWADRLYSSTPLSTGMGIISAAYFVHDMIHSLEHYHVQGMSYVIHGLGCACIYMYALLQTPTVLHLYGAGFLMWELSSFPVHFRWFMFKMGAPPNVALINGLVLIITFFGARIVWGFYISYYFFVDVFSFWAVNPTFTIICSSCCTAITILNIWWFYLILHKAVLTLTGQDSFGKRD